MAGLGVHFQKSTFSLSPPPFPSKGNISARGGPRGEGLIIELLHLSKAEKRIPALEAQHTHVAK